MFEFLNYKKTNFIGGGLRIKKGPLVFKNAQQVDSRFVAPRKRDNRDLCIMTSNQSDTPKCAAFSMAGYIEVRNWRIKHYPEQVEPSPIYNGAKQLDGDFNPGTSLDNAAMAALNLKLISGEISFIQNTVNDIKFAIHQNDVFVGGFMITNEWNSVNSKTGRISVLTEDKIIVLGGHAVLVCGYDDDGIYIQNSWGPYWGLYGFAFLSWEQVFMQFSYGVVIN